MTRQEAEFQLAELTDAICLRDFSARIQRIRLKKFLGLPTPSEAEVVAEHQRMMDEAMKEGREFAARREAIDDQLYNEMFGKK